MSNLHPTTSGELPGDPPETATIVVGTNPWDADPDTYTVQTTTRKTGLGQTGYTIGTWDEPPPAETTELVLHMRYRARNYGPGATGTRVEILFGDDTLADLYLVVTALAEDVLVTDNADHELVIPFGTDLLTANGTDLPTLLAQMTSPYGLVVSRLSTFADTVNATPFNRYELTITDLYFEAVTAAVVEPVRVTRQFPRDDAYGLGSAPRLVPAPCGGRIVGGYQ